MRSVNTYLLLLYKVIFTLNKKGHFQDMFGHQLINFEFYLP